MNKILALVLCICSFIYAVEAAPANMSKLNWLTNYEEAVSKAKVEKKPILLFFTGSDWCGWCHKLENEALSTTEFADLVGNKFIFVLVDFPIKTVLDPKVAAQNKELQKKYDVKGFPSIVLLDEGQQQMGVTGYRPGGARAYADHLLKIVNDFKGYKQQVSHLGIQSSKSENLIALFCKAKELCRHEDANKIVKLGMEEKDNRFFLLERFRFLADEGQIHEAEAQAIRQELLAKDAFNKEKTHYEIAVIEFEAFSEEMEKEDYAPEIAVAPLVAYIDRFGEEDKENVWRLEMIIAQVFLDKNKTKEAIKHARYSHASAPSSVKEDILAFIQNVQN